MTRLDSLLQFLEADPQNRALLTDAAKAALSENKPAIARDLLKRAASLGPLDDDALNLTGLAAMRDGDAEAATAIFGALRQSHPNDPALSFNLAWALALGRRFEDALDALSDEAVATLAQAAMLKVQILHELERLDEAMAAAKEGLLRHGDHPGFNAAVSVLAIDCEDLELARTSALKAQNHPDALTTMATLALDDDETSQARALFEAALAANDKTPRAWVGLGLSKLSQGASHEAARDLEHGAEMFGDHIGSWIAAGWAQLVAGDNARARADFQRALDIDPAFSESQGSLAVISLLEGDQAQAKRYCETALRLDRQSYAGALARALLAAGDGQEARAKEIIEHALNTPIDASGRTIAQMLAKRGLSR